MARVIVSKEARSDLVSIRDYIRDELLSPDAAQRILAELKKSISSLAHYNRPEQLYCTSKGVFFV